MGGRHAGALPRPAEGRDTAGRRPAAHAGRNLADAAFSALPTTRLAPQIIVATLFAAAATSKFVGRRRAENPPRRRGFEMTRKGFCFAGALQLVALLSPMSRHRRSPRSRRRSSGVAIRSQARHQAPARRRRRRSTSCHAKRIAETIAQGTDCNSVVDADLSREDRQGRGEAREQVPAKCPGLHPGQSSTTTLPGRLRGKYRRSRTSPMCRLRRVRRSVLRGE
jgi:hypothetical protein